MHKIVRRMATAVALAFALLAGAVGMAHAASCAYWVDIKTSAVRFYGNIKWYNQQEHHGGYSFYGTLYDLKKSNGRPVNFQERPMSYSWRVWTAPKDQDRSIPTTYDYDGAVIITPQMTFKVCEVILILPDSCTQKTEKNPFYTR